MQVNIGIAYASLAAILFGAGMPFAKLLIEQTTALLLAGLLYLGSGMNLMPLPVIKIYATQPINNR